MSYQADVIGKPITANDIKQGNVVTDVTNTGTKHTVEPETNKAPVPSQVYSDYDGRFDDNDYYTA